MCVDGVLFLLMIRNTLWVLCKGNDLTFDELPCQFCVYVYKG